MSLCADPRQGFVVSLIVVLLLFALSGCAPMTEKYWQEKYESMTAEELAEVNTEGEFVMVCNLTDCITVWVY